MFLNRRQWRERREKLTMDPDNRSLLRDLDALFASLQRRAFKGEL